MGNKLSNNRINVIHNFKNCSLEKTSNGILNQAWPRRLPNFEEQAYVKSIKKCKPGINREDCFTYKGEIYDWLI